MRICWSYKHPDASGLASEALHLVSRFHHLLGAQALVANLTTKTFSLKLAKARR